MKHHLHLKESQKQLEELLSTEDPDIIDAFEENKSVLIDQLRRLDLFKEERNQVLRELGSHYADESPIQEDINVNSSPQETLPIQPNVGPANGDDEKQPDGKEDGGFWL